MHTARPSDLDVDRFRDVPEPQPCDACGKLVRPLKHAAIWIGTPEGRQRWHLKCFPYHAAVVVTEVAP
jgi:hypothetical protein